MRGSWRPNKDCNILTSPAPPDIAVCRSRSPGLLNRRAGGPLCWVLAFSTTSCHQRVSKLTDFPSSPSYIIVQSPTQYLPTTGHRDVSLPLSLEWHVWWSSNGNNCHAVHRSLSSGASVWLYPRDFTLSHFVSQARPRQWNMHFRRLLNDMFGRVEGQYTTQVYSRLQDFTKYSSCGLWGLDASSDLFKPLRPFYSMECDGLFG